MKSNRNHSIELSEAADENFVVHASWLQQRIEGMHVDVEDRLVIVDSGMSCDTFNLVCRARLARQEAPGRCQAVVDRFAAARRPYSWWVGPADQPSNLGDVLAACGLEAAESEVAMSMQLAHLRPEPVPAGLDVRRANTTRELRDAATVLAANWSPPDPLVVEFYERASVALLDDTAPIHLYVGYFEENPVACAELTLAGGVAGLYNIATLASFRRRGIGTAMTVCPLVDAVRFGVETAVLQASQDGVGVYERVGFAPFGVVTEFKPTEFT